MGIGDCKRSEDGFSLRQDSVCLRTIEVASLVSTFLPFSLSANLPGSFLVLSVKFDSDTRSKRLLSVQFETALLHSPQTPHPFFCQIVTEILHI